MDPIGIELAKAVAKSIGTPIAKLVGEGIVDKNADELTKAFPVLGRLRSCFRFIRSSDPSTPTKVNGVAR